MTRQANLQYYCVNCKNILCEAESEIGTSGISEPCPFCGSLLSECLQKRHLVQRTPRPVLFQVASKVPRITVDIKMMDDVLPFLSMGQKILLVGHHSQKLVERLAVRAQLPHRYGGMGSHVVIVDGGNSSDPYLGVSFARQYGLDASHAMSRIISSRAFTVYQLENLITKELPSVVRQYGAKAVMISDMLAMFSDDPYLDDDDAKNMLYSISESISNLKDCLVMASVSKPTRHYDIIAKSFDRIMHLKQADDGIAVDIGGKICTLKESDLEIVRR